MEVDSIVRHTPLDLFSSNSGQTDTNDALLSFGSSPYQTIHLATNGVDEPTAALASPIFNDAIGFNTDDQYGHLNLTAHAAVPETLPPAPTAAGHSQTVAPGTSVPLSTLFTYSAASGDSIVGFDVEETTNNGGYLTDNGVKEPSGQLFGSGEFGIPISQISQWAFVAGPAGTTDTIGFNVDDQYGQFNPTVTATVTGHLPSAPTAAGHSQTVAPGTSVALSTLFTYSAASGDSIVGFDVEETTNNGGYLTDNGVKEPSGQLFGSGEFGIPISQISQWAFVAGPAGTTDTIGFNVDDQYGQFNPTVTATVTGHLPSAPTAAGHSQTVAPGTSISLSTLFTYSAASGDSIVGFDVEETTNNGGYLTDNGVKEPSGQLFGSGEFGIPISQISQWAFVAGSSGTDTVRFNVDDQYGQFNPTVSATVSENLPARPTAAGHSQSVTPGTSVPLSTLFTYSAASGDSIVGFDVKETTNNGGYLTDNGVREPSGKLFGSGEFGIPISQISQWAFVAGPAGTTDTIKFNVDDQYGQFNPTVAATVTGSGSTSSEEGIDYSHNTNTNAIPAPDIASAGNQFVGEYIGVTNNVGYLRPTEAAQLEKQGLSIVSLFEKYPTSPSYFKPGQGTSDAEDAYKAAQKAHQPFGTAIYFTVDFDPGGKHEAANLAKIDSYFQEINTYFSSLPSGSSYQIGVYGAGAACSTVMNDPLCGAKYSWLSGATGWAGSSTYTAWNILQYDNEQTSIDGTPVDLDKTSSLQFGQWGGSQLVADNNAPAIQHSEHRALFNSFENYIASMNSAVDEKSSHGDSLIVHPDGSLGVHSLLGWVSHHSYAANYEIGHHNFLL